MDNELKEKISKSITGFRLPRYKEITDVGLYLEQTVRYVNAQLKPLGEAEITGSMVSNYVKQKLVANPQKKQYCAEHIARLIFISIVKISMSLEDISMMRLQQEYYSPRVAYDYFCDEFENMLNDAFGIAEAVEGLGDTESEAKDLLQITIMSAVKKIYLNQYLVAFRETLHRNRTESETS